MERVFRAFTMVSALAAVFVTATFALSFRVRSDSWHPGYRLADGLHLGTMDGDLCMYSHAVFSGGSFEITDDSRRSKVRETGIRGLGGYLLIVRMPAGTA